MGRSSKSNPQQSSEKSIAVITAIIACVGAITVAVSQYVIPQILAIQATQNAESKQLTQTHTFTPTGTSTPTDTTVPTHTFTPTVTPGNHAIYSGEDWKTDCISLKVWQLYQAGNDFPSADKSGCLNLIDWGLYAQSSRLFLTADDASKPRSSTIYTALPKKSKFHIKLTINIEKLKYYADNVSTITLGIGNSEGWIMDGKFLFFRAYKGYKLIRVGYGTSISKEIQNYFPDYTTGSHDVDFSIDGAEMTIFYDNVKVLGPKSLTANDRQVFWIGFRLQEKGSIRAIISDFVIEE